MRKKRALLALMLIILVLLPACSPKAEDPGAKATEEPLPAPPTGSETVPAPAPSSEAELQTKFQPDPPASAAGPEELAVTDSDISYFSTLFHGMKSVSGNKIVLQDDRSVTITKNDQGYLYSVDDGASHVASFTQSTLRLPVAALMREGSLVVGDMILPASSGVAVKLAVFLAGDGETVAWDAYNNELAVLVARTNQNAREVCELWFFRADGSKVLLYSCPMVRGGEEEMLYSVAFDISGNIYIYEPGSELPASGWSGKTLIFKAGSFSAPASEIDILGAPRPMADRRYVGLSRRLSGGEEEVIYDSKSGEPIFMTDCRGLFASNEKVVISDSDGNQIFSQELGYETDRLPEENLLAAYASESEALFLGFEDGFALRRFSLPHTLRRGITSVKTGTRAGKIFMGEQYWLDGMTLLYYTEKSAGLSTTYNFYAVTADEGEARNVLTLTTTGPQAQEQIVTVVPYDGGMMVATSERILFYDSLFNFVRERPVPMTQGFYGDLTAWTVNDISNDGSRILYTAGGSLYLSNADFSEPLMIYESFLDEENTDANGATVAGGARFSPDDSYVGFVIIDREYIVGNGVYDTSKKDLNIYEGGTWFTWLENEPENMYLCAGNDAEGDVIPMVRNVVTGEAESYAPEWVGSVGWIDSRRLVKVSEGNPALISVVAAKEGSELYSFEPFHSSAFPYGVVVSPGGKYIALHNEYAFRDDVLYIIELP